MPETPTTVAAAPAAPATGTSSTPPVAAAPSAPSTPSPAPTTVAAPAAAPTPSAPTPAVATTGSEAPTEGVTPVTAPTELPAPLVGPLFKLPEDVKLAEPAIAKFEAQIRPRLGADGKLSLTPQEVADMFIDQARDGQARWQAQITAQNAAWEAESKQRFTPAQLAAAETGVGFFTSYDPEYRGLAQQFKNAPVFVNAMRLVGERLSQDRFEMGGSPTPAAPRSRAEIMGYTKPKSAAG